MNIIFTKHFLSRARERNINSNLVSRCILKPDLLISTPPNRYRSVNYFKKDNRQYLLVVIFDRVDNNIVVVTAFITSKIDKYLKYKLYQIQSEGMKDRKKVLWKNIRGRKQPIRILFCKRKFL